MKQIGYHYTSLDVWRKIQLGGYLIPQHCWVHQVSNFFPEGFQGIWLWTKNPKGLNHTGNVVSAMGRRKSTDIVKLKVRYNEDDILSTPLGTSIEFSNWGDINGYTYHSGEKAVVVTAPIYITDIKLIGDYDLLGRLQ